MLLAYKIKELARLEFNLQNQNFDYYLPKITLQKLNSSLKEELMFPGYVFIKTSVKNYLAIKYTKGIKNS